MLLQPIPIFEAILQFVKNSIQKPLNEILKLKIPPNVRNQKVF